MPLNGKGEYVAPNWTNGGPPALDADELNAMSQTLAKIGDPSDAADALGVSDKTVGSILKTLSDVANFHVWKKESGFHPWKLEYGPKAYFPFYQGNTTNTQTIQYYSTVKGFKDGDVISVGSHSDFKIQYSTTSINSLVGKFVLMGGTYYYVPTGAKTRQRSEGSSSNTTYCLDVECQKMSVSTPYSDKTEYVVSTERNKYQDEPSDGKGYFLGAVQELTLYRGTNTGSSYYTTWCTTKNPPITLEGYLRKDASFPWRYVQAYYGMSDYSSLLGSFVYFYSDKNASTGGDTSKVYFIQSDSQITQKKDGSMYTVVASKAQPITMMNMTFADPRYTYQGLFAQEKPSIKVVRYIGTGAFGEGFPCCITGERPIKLALMLYDLNSNNINTQWVKVDALSTEYLSGGFYYSSGGYPFAKRSEDGKTLYWYNGGAASYQCNSSGTKYHVALFF